MHNEKFIGPFINFLKENINFHEHLFIIVGGVSENISQIPKYNNVICLDESYQGKCNLKYISFLNNYTQKASKIIFHSLFNKNVLYYLFFNQKILPKSYWVVWGADLYVYNRGRKTVKDKINHYIRQKVYSKLGFLITYIPEDFKLAQKWYDVKGKYCECFMYPSNLYKDYAIPLKLNESINIQVGNSADPTNNHIAILNKLKKYKDENIKIFAILSYGDQEYAREVISKGKELFGNKFIAVTEFMVFEKYLEFLGSIDIAVFAHKRQQAMGNIITLLGLGKKVYMEKDISSSIFFQSIGVEVFDIENIDLDLIAEEKKNKNKLKIKRYFSKEKYIRQLKTIFDE